MRSITPSTSARRQRRAAERRSRRRPAILAAGLAVGLVAAVGATVAVPQSPAKASPAAGVFALASYGAPVSFAQDTVAGDTTGVEIRQAVAAAEQSITAADAVETDIQASGLDVGVAAPTVDTDELETAAARLDGAEKLPAVLAAAIVDDVTELVASVDAETSGLRGSLDAAIAVKAAEEAAAQAQREAEAAAAAAAAAEAEASASSSPTRSAPNFAGPGTSAGEAQAIARGMLAGYGWGDDQFGCLVSLWDRESGWNSRAYNASSGAYGIPQALPGSKMSSAGADWETNAATQISWGLGYISGRYGSPCGAWDHSNSVGWY
jgi:hypothetical protein